MTPAQERELLKRVRLGIQKDLTKATEELQALIRKGMPPRDAVDQVFGKFADDYGRIYRQSMEKIGVDQTASPVNLSQNLYAQKNAVSAAVQLAVERHVKGYQDARQLARELYEGYDNEAQATLKITKKSRQLPKYMRESVMATGDIGALKRQFAKLQAKGLKTAALNAAYQDVLRAIDEVEGGAGRDLLDKRIQVAFYEKGRFYANRVAQTELHRSYTKGRATEIMDDDDIEYVEIRRSGKSETKCICDKVTTANLHGMGAGVYPKKLAPAPPYHPFCRCVVAPRLDLTGKKPKAPKPADFIDEANRKTDPTYQIKTLAQLIDS